jgi:F-type H+-transporting ATPase subunit epsilon
MPGTDLTLKIVTPESVFFEGKVRHVMAPGGLGYLGILKDHAPFVTTVQKGNLVFEDLNRKTQKYMVDGGFLEVSDNRVLVLTDKIEP